MKGRFLLSCLLLCGGVATGAESITVGAKTFPESAILGQMVVLLARDAGIEGNLRELAGTKLVWSALKAGDIQLYPEIPARFERRSSPAKTCGRTMHFERGFRSWASK